MRKITLTPNPGDVLTGQLADNWGEVPLAGYAQLAAAKTLPARCEATAALVGVPAGPLLEDVSLFAAIAEAAPWLFGDELPDDDAPVPYFTHDGVTYQHQGNLDKITALQLEALYTFQKAYRARPLDACPALLAILYCPQGQTQTAEVVEYATEALRTLPMSVAWPALGFFFRSGGPQSLRIRTASALGAQVDNLLRELETSLTKTPIRGGFSICSSKLLRFLARRWLASVKKMHSIRWS